MALRRLQTFVIPSAQKGRVPEGPVQLLRGIGRDLGRFQTADRHFEDAARGMRRVQQAMKSQRSEIRYVIEKDPGVAFRSRKKPSIHNRESFFCQGLFKDGCYGAPVLRCYG
jgi:hypothetical protein